MRLILMALIATLTAMASQPAGALAMPNTQTHDDHFVLEGYASSAWAEIATDQYTVLPSGSVLKRSTDDSGTDVDWTTYSAFRWSGSIWTPGGAVEIEREAVTFEETTQSDPIDADNVTDLDTARFVTATELRVGTTVRGDENGITSEHVQLTDVLRVGMGVQTKRPRTLANVDNGGGGGEWTNPESARKSDDKRATTETLGMPLEYTQVLRATDFNFKVPRNATITQVELEMYGYNDPAMVIVHKATLTAGGDTKEYTFDTFLFDQLATTGDTLGTWGANLSPDVVNRSDFGVNIWVEGNNITYVQHYLNAIRLTVYYTTAETGTTVLDVSGDAALDGVLNLAASATPTNAAQSSDANVYVKDGKLVVQYNDAGTVRYKYLDLTGTGVTWTHSTSAP